jgi:predicted nucleotidyltransferase
MLNNYQKILAVLFEQPEYKFHLRELARRTNLNPNTILNITKILEEQKVILRKKEKNLLIITNNTESLEYKKKKQLFNLSLLYESGLIDYLNEYYHSPSLIILFGSFSRGEDWSDSDIDIAINTAKKERPDLSKWERQFKRRIHLFHFDYAHLSEELTVNLINGFILKGYFNYEQISELFRRKKSKKS